MNSRQPMSIQPMTTITSNRKPMMHSRMRLLQPPRFLCGCLHSPPAVVVLRVAESPFFSASTTRSSTLEPCKFSWCNTFACFAVLGYYGQFFAPVRDLDQGTHPSSSICALLFPTRIAAIKFFATKHLRNACFPQPPATWRITKSTQRS